MHDKTIQTFGPRCDHQKRKNLVCTKHSVTGNMSSIIKYWWLIYLCSTVIAVTEHEECFNDTSANKEINRLRDQLEMKDKQIEYLSKKLDERRDSFEVKYTFIYIYIYTHI